MTHHRPSKRLGQHFLISEEIINRIVELINPKSNQNLVEVGPGKGALTGPLAASGARIVAVEFDRRLFRHLEELSNAYANLTIVNEDFLAFDPYEHGLKRFTLCGNLPYNLTSPVIDWTVRYREQIERGIFMIQKEVALRLSSTPGSKDWSPLAIFTQLHFQVGFAFSVSPQHFSPKPDVTSAVIELLPKESPKVGQFAKFEEVVRKSFKQRRKLLINNLVPSPISSVEIAEQIFRELGLERKARAEEIDIAKFLELTEALSARNIV